MPAAVLSGNLAPEAGITQVLLSLRGGGGAQSKPPGAFSSTPHTCFPGRGKGKVPSPPAWKDRGCERRKWQLDLEMLNLSAIGFS